MQSRTVALLTMLITLPVAFVVSAQPQEPWVSVTVWRSTAGACTGGQESILYLDPGEDATINLSTCADRVNIVTSPLSTVDIGRLTFTGGPGTFPVDIVLGNGEINQADTPVTPVGRDLEGIDTGWLYESRFAGAINGSLVGPIDVHHMYRFDALGEIRSGIKVGSPYPGGGLVLEANAIAPGGWLEVVSGNIKRVRTYGDMEGAVIADNGAISPDGIIVDGNIGAPGAPVTIRAGYGNIAKVTAQSIYANITAIEGLQFSGYLERLEATNGQFVGNINAKELRNNNEVSQFSCVGDMEANITLSGNLGDPLIITGGDYPDNFMLNATSLAPFDGKIQITEIPNTPFGGHLFGDMLFGGTIGIDRDIELDNGLCGLLRIGYSLTGDLSIFGTPGLPNEGITGQVIINALNWPDDEPNGWGQWTGTVNIGPQGAVETLDPKPYYNNKAVDIGGGAVGRVPYYLHYTDSQPTGTKVDEGPDGHENGLGECEEGYHALKKVHPAWSLPKVTLRHYGPILQEGTGKPFTAKRKTIYTLACDAGGNPNWADVTANFTHSFPANENRAIEINGSFAPGFDYLIEPKVDENGTDYLYCGGLDPLIDNVPIMEYDYRLRVIVAPDITGNGLLQADDITAWVLDPQDANLDGTTDNNDLVDVINAVAEYGE